MVRGAHGGGWVCVVRGAHGRVCMCSEGSTGWGVVRGAHGVGVWVCSEGSTGQVYVVRGEHRMGCSEGSTRGGVCSGEYTGCMCS